MRVECGIQDGKCQVPQYWLEKFRQARGYEADTVVFDLSDASPLVPAGVFLIKKEVIPPIVLSEKGKIELERARRAFIYGNP